MRKASAVVALVILGSVLWAQFKRPSDQVWDVVIMGLPSSVSIKDIETASVGYILSQTHKPLFKKNADGEHVSDVLMSWNKELADQSLQLCPKTNIRIGNAEQLTPERLADFLNRHFKLNHFSGSAQTEGNCVVVPLPTSTQEFISHFSKLENAPTWDLDRNGFETGLGDYYIDNVASNLISLRRKHLSNYGFNEIIVHAYENKAELEKLTKNGDIEDVNRVSFDLVPDAIKKTYTDYGVVLLHTGVLLLNIKNKLTRQAIYNCLNIDEFRKAFSPTQEYFKDIQTILPVGVPGAREGRVVQRCIPPYLKLNRTVKFWNWKDNNSDTLKQFWVKFRELTGISVTQEEIKLTKLMKVVKLEETEHELLVVGLSSTEFQYHDFYQYIFDPAFMLLPKVNVDFRQTLNLLDSQILDTERVKHIRKLDDYIAHNALAIPLFQQTRHFYYPNRIKRLSFGTDFLEHPIIADLMQ